MINPESAHITRLSLPAQLEKITSRDAAAAGPEAAAAMPLATAMSLIGTFSTTLVRADGVACAAGSRTWAETSQTSTTTATAASAIRCAALSAAAGS